MAKQYTSSNVSFSDFRVEVSRRSGYPAHIVDAVIRCSFDVIKYYLYNKLQVSIPRFGKFSLKFRPSKIYKMPNGSTVFHAAYHKPNIRYYAHFMQQMKNTGVKGNDDEKK